MSDHHWDDQLEVDTHQQERYDYQPDDYDEYDSGLFDAVLDTAPPARPTGRLFYGLLIGGSAFVVAVAVSIALLVLVIVPRQQAAQAAQQALEAAQLAFSQASNDYSQAQSDLQAGVTSAQSIVDNVTADQVDDASTLDGLASVLASASALLAPAPVQAAATEDINQQVADLNSKTLSTQTATTALTQAINDVQTSRVNFAVTSLSTAIASAQKIYNGSGWLGETNERAALQTQLDAGAQAIDDPTSLGVNTDAVIAALASVQKAVTTAAKAVTTAQTKAGTATYTYTLKLSNGEVSCGFNLCPSVGYEVSILTTVKVTVKNTTVTAVLTWQSGQSLTFTGTRDADTAKVRQNGTGAATTMWGTITFQDEYPNSPAIQFTSADSCQRWNGSFGTEYYNVCV